MPSLRSSRGQRGVVFPSPVVILSVIAVAMAGVAFLVTQGSDSPEREITTASDQQSTAAATAGSASASGTPTSSGSASGSVSPPSSSASTAPSASAKPALDRATTSVVVFNNSRQTGLAAQVATKVGQVGWKVLGADNWYGTIPATTVYYPPQLKAAGKQLALDLGITRTAPAVDPMKDDQLTVILTGPLA